MVNATLELVGITIVAVAVLYAGAFLFVKKVMDNSDDTTIFHLAQPLIVSNEPAAVRLRLDAALRDAEEGFNACDVCGFENLKRNIFCSLCGATVQAVPVVTLPSEAKDLLDIEGSVVSANDHQHRRKARALKRKEWTRRLDVEGKLYWFRDAFRIDSGSHLRRGFVVQFSGSPLEKLDPLDSATPEQPEIEPLLTEDRDADARVKDDANQPELRESVLELSDDDVATDAADGNPQPRTKRRLALRSLEDTQQVLLSEKSARELTLVDSSIADPSRPSVLLHATSLFSEDPNTLVRNTTLDFPSKMAEFVTRTSTAVMVADQSFLKVNIRRNKLLQNSIEAFAAMPADHTRCPMRMAFLGEQGIDAGGVYREWLELVSQEIVVPEAGIFRCVDSRDRSFYLNPTSQHDIGEHHLAHLLATGRLLGRMLLEGNVTGFHLALPLLKIMVGQPVTFSDLEFFDPDAYKKLSWLLENDGVDALGLDFTVTKQTANGQTIVVELIPNGANIDVTDANKHEYVDLKFKYLLFGSVESQLFAFLKGLYEVMPPELLMLFDAEELDFVLSGSDEIDVDDWERNSKYTENLIEHPVRGWFWNLVREMPNEYRRRLLLFSTGSSRVPLAGFASLTSYDGRLCPFMLKGVDMAEGGEYIHSHACFNRLDLPRYAKKRDLKAVLYGILDTDLYGFTTA